MAKSGVGADVCELCGSTHFHIDNGLRYCDNGHEQAVRPHREHSFSLKSLSTDNHVQGGQQIADDVEEYGIHGKRTITKKDKGKAKTSKSICLQPLSVRS